tara:strand:+ start:12 stop:239 length:228 start_codon:yes stop_codon:yes gene_type:complete
MTNYSKEITGSVASLHISNNSGMSNESTETIQVEFDGIVTDKHRSYMRGAYEGESYQKERYAAMIVSGQQSLWKN